MYRMVAVATVATVSMCGCQGKKEETTFSNVGSYKSIDEISIGSELEPIIGETKFIFPDEGDQDVFSGDVSEGVALFDELKERDYDEITDDDLELLLSYMQPVEEERMIGTWNRTMCHCATEGTISIEMIDEYSATASGGFDHFGNMGEIEHVGFFVDDSHFVVVDREYEAIYFMEEEDGLMSITQVGMGGMGMNVSADGVYTQDEPEYTNTDDIVDNFTEDEISEIRSLIESNGEDYEERFENAILYGMFNTTFGNAVMSDGDSVSGTWYESYAPHGITYDLTMFISADGYIYMESGWNGSEEFLYLTNDPFEDSMPTPEV